MDEETTRQIQSLIEAAVAPVAEKLEAVSEQAAQADAGGVTAEQVAEIVAARLAERDPTDAGGVTAEQVAEIVAARLAERDQAAQADADEKADQADQVAAREAFIADQADGLPEAYRAMIPVTADPDELAKGLDAARKQLQADADAGGWTVPDVNPGVADGEAAAADRPSEQEASRSGIEDLKDAYQ